MNLQTKLRHRNLKINKKSIIVALTALFVFISLSVSTAILWVLYKKEKEPIHVLATISDIKGEVLYHPNRGSNRGSAFKGLQLFNYDRIQVAKDAFVILHFQTGQQLKIFENSEFNLRFWDNKNEQLPIFISLRRGQYQWLNEIENDQIIIETDQHLIKTAMHSPPYHPSEFNENSLSKTDLEPSFEITPQDPRKSLISGTIIKPTNREISFKIQKSLEQFQKCQLNALGNNLVARGQLTVAFFIFPDGHTDNISIMKSNTQNNLLDACVKSVFERMNFQKFEGDPIQVNYPLRFE